MFLSKDGMAFCEIVLWGEVFRAELQIKQYNFLYLHQIYTGLKQHNYRHLSIGWGKLSSSQTSCKPLYLNDTPPP